jgi:hypothetical protein
MGKRKVWLLHLDNACGGPVLFMKLLNRDHGQCNGCGAIGWLDQDGAPEKYTRIMPATEAETAAIIKQADIELEPKSYANVFNPPRMHVGDYQLNGKKMYGETCECKFCLKERERLAKCSITS